MKKQYIFSVIFSLFILLNNFTFVYAQPQGADTNNPEQETQEVLDNSPAPHAQAALLMDMKSGKLLFEKNSAKKMYPASTTKILTSIIALENTDMSTVVTASAEAINPITNKHSHMGILIGEELTVEQLIYGTLVYSANDAANVLAVHIAGSLDAFATMMNTKAQELGMVNSHFVNPHGFHDDNHYTTAYDLALVAKYAMQNETFREIVKTDMYTIDPTNKYHETRYLSNTNHLVSNRRTNQYLYKKATGIKTGFTDEAGACLVSSAADGDTEFLAVVMNCKNTTAVARGSYSFVDSISLLDYGFENFKYITIAANGDIVSDSGVYEAKKNVRVALTPEKDVSALLPSDIKKEEIEIKTILNTEINAPIAKGDVLGTVECVYKGEVVGNANLVATNDVEKDYIVATIHLFVKIVTNPIFIVLFILFLFLYIRSRIIRMRKRKKRRNQLNYVNYQQNRNNIGTDRQRYQRRKKN